ncbi:NAD(P)H-dependent oxidoreductase subunit E [Acidaminobacter sp. JC074]|uniref:NADH-quinone oxidoreductase subunit NuoE family protein n=1 Tax=Acidaminobacter sp. JC074 TaxID=2530199 RepID=UPI001F0D17EC|nr:NAD(P)H-dependent oxidoreductase subunit E [Acidaminobacter sp. JC074]MCH4890891.1 NAD(P)H-dependent oxidoreductase subunit E [Acidaminobacter sp. JC074]
MKPEAQKATISVPDLPQEGYEALDKFIAASAGDESALISVLHKAQSIFGYLPREVQLYVGRKLNVSGAKVFGVVSFYSYFTTNPVGKHVINLCTGTACYVKGIEPVFDKFKELLAVDNGETTPDGLFTLKDIRCVGACGLAPVVVIGDKVFGHVTVDDVEGIIEQYRKADQQ